MIIATLDVVSDVADDFYSPFYKREVQGEEIGKIVLDAKDLNFYDIFTQIFNDNIYL